jgi:hypothetical protein
MTITQVNSGWPFQAWFLDQIAEASAQGAQRCLTLGSDDGQPFKSRPSTAYCA